MAGCTTLTWVPSSLKAVTCSTFVSFTHLHHPSFMSSPHAHPPVTKSRNLPSRLFLPHHVSVCVHSTTMPATVDVTGVRGLFVATSCLRVRYCACMCMVFLHVCVYVGMVGAKKCFWCMCAWDVFGRRSAHRLAAD